MLTTILLLVCLTLVLPVVLIASGLFILAYAVASAERRRVERRKS